MSRTARKISRTNIYHVILRGVNHHQIFYDDEDYGFYIYLLKKYHSICKYKLYAYCLMGNHIHLLIHADGEPLDIVFRKLGSAFALWYNAKYDRVGHIFQGRFKSEPVENDRYFLTVLRYILNNPVKAGLCDKMSDYAFSNSKTYLFGIKDFTDTDALPVSISHDDLRAFLQYDCTDECMDIDEAPKKHYTDSGAKVLIIKELGTFNPYVGKPRERNSLNQSIRFLSNQGVSIRQLNRLTGIPKKVIETALKQD